jgi:hypothetical protein
MENSEIGRLLGALVSPGKTFRSIAERPTWVAPLLLLLILTGAISVLVQERIDPDEMRKAFAERIEKAQGGKASDADVDRAVGMARKVSAFRFFGGSDISFKTSFSTTLHAFMPAAVAALLTLPVILSRERIGVQEAQSGNLLASNLGAFAPEDASPVVRALLGSVDFFSLWTVCLLILGYRLTAKVSTGTAATVVLVLWAVGVAAKVGLAAAFGG